MPFMLLLNITMYFEYPCVPDDVHQDTQLDGKTLRFALVKETPRCKMKT